MRETRGGEILRQMLKGVQPLTSQIDSPRSFGHMADIGHDYPASGSILAIDDDEPTLGVLIELLEINGFSVFHACEGREGIEVFEREHPDLVITDIRMPRMNGLEVLARVREIDESVPVVLVTGHGDLNNALKALREGAHDFLLKPINPEILLNTVRKGMEHCRLRRFEMDHTRLLEEEVENRTEELATANGLLRKSHRQLKRTQDAAIFALAKLAESRSGEMGWHLRRIQEYCKVLCAQLSVREQYRQNLTQKFVDDLVQSSVLHDIGKVAIPDSILFNPRKFRMDEFEIMKQHTLRGGRALEEAEGEIGEGSFLSIGKEVAYYHHERWDGKGYPFGLKEEEIPLAARIVAIADVYDALTTQRLYKRAYTHEESKTMIVEESGRQFDPEVVAAFQEVEARFRAIRDELALDDVGDEDLSESRQVTA